MRARASLWKRATAAAAVLLGASAALRTEQLTLSTSYPAPMGVYSRVVTTGQGPSGAAHTLLARDGGRVGVGTDNPQAKLHVAGTLRLGLGGTQGAGRVLTSDAQGDATWQDPAAAPNFTTSFHSLTHDATTSSGHVFNCPSGRRVLSCWTHIAPQGNFVCGTSVSGGTCNYGGCTAAVPLGNASWRTLIVCGGF